MSAVSYQGISDHVAYSYMVKHGRATWCGIKRGLDRGASCPKLKSYWHFHDCRYDKISRTCAEPEHIRRCPLPKFILRNGRLNQTAYSLFLFIRDVAEGDLIGWIDRQLQDGNHPVGPDGLARMRANLIEPLREVYGVSDKVLTMALSSILLGAPKRMSLWIEVGGSMIAIDTRFTTFSGPVAAQRSFKPWPTGSMLDSSTRLFRSPFPGSFNTRFGDIAIRTASMSATATALMTAKDAPTAIAECDPCATAWRCAELLKTRQLRSHETWVAGQILAPISKIGRRHEHHGNCNAHPVFHGYAWSLACAGYKC